MSFFSTEFAQNLQLFTFPLEFVGLALATIEVKFPRLASDIAGTMDDFAARFQAFHQANQRDTHEIKALWHEGNRIEAIKRFFRDDYSEISLREFLRPISHIFSNMEKLFSWLFVLLFVAFLCIALVSVLVHWHIVDISFDAVLRALWSATKFLGFVIMLLALLTAIVFLAWIFLSVASYFSTSFVEGKAVGTLGIGIAGLGLLGEAYQFTTQTVT